MCTGGRNQNRFLSIDMLEMNGRKSRWQETTERVDAVCLQDGIFYKSSAPMLPTSLCSFTKISKYW